MNPGSAIPGGKLFSKICRHHIEHTQTLGIRFRSACKERWDEFKLLLEEHPSLACLLKISIPLIVVLIWLGVIVAYNTYSLYKVNCQHYYAQVGVEVKRRADLIPNLVICVTRYETHEKDIMKHVADARQALSGPGDMEGKIAASKAMQGALGRLLAIVEQYPNLKASEPVQSLLKELGNTENRIADWKGKYNESARVFNNLYTSFPTNILGWCFGYNRQVPYINTDEDLIRAYMVKFGAEQGQ